MKLKLYTFLLIITPFCLIAQTQDLLNMAKGKFINFDIIYNNYDPDRTCNICTEEDDVYGYYTIYNNGEVVKNLEEIEYILLDKNLNKFANGTFKKLIAPRKSASRLRVYKTKDTMVFRNSVYSTAPFSYFKGIIVYQKLLLKNNTFLPPYYYNNEGKKQNINLDSLAETFTKKRLKKLDDETEWSKEKKDSTTFNKTLFSYNNRKNKLILKKNGTSKKRYVTNIYDEALLFRKNKEEQWRTDLLQAEKKEKIYHHPLFIDRDEKTIALKRYIIGKKKDESDILLFDLENGNPKGNYTFNTDRDYEYRDYENLNGNTLTILSSLISGIFMRGFNFSKYDIKLNKEIKSKQFFWPEANEYIEIGKNGHVAGGLQLRFLNYFFLKNGNIGILTEKFRAKANGKTVTTDYVFFMFNKDFELENATTIAKDKSKTFASNVDYLFSQQVEGGSIVFYRDYKKDQETKDKNWVLGIITYINGEFGHQTLPMTSDEYSIIPFPAKEGYVLLTEFNEKEEKYNKIRLEKINY